MQYVHLIPELYSTPELVFSLPETDVYIAVIVLMDVKPYKYKYKKSLSRPLNLSSAWWPLHGEARMVCMSLSALKDALSKTSA
jgi:hypothetical protein